jgi:hypothetical protein
MADKGRFEGLVVNFQSLPPKPGQHWLITWLKILAIWLVAAGVMYLLSLLI